VPFAAGLSEHPVTAEAVGEVAGQVLEALGPGSPPPDLALLFVTPPHAGALEDAAAAVRTLLGPRTLLGCAAESVVGGSREVEEHGGVSLWAGHTGTVAPFHLQLEATPDGHTLTGWPQRAPEAPSALVLLADPFSFPADAFLARADEDFPGLPVVGGMASAARGPGGNRLVIDDRVLTHGAVGAFLGPDVEVTTVVSQGCRPVGDPFAVTKAERNIVYELAGRPALERLQDVARRASDDDRRLLGGGVHLGRVIDEQQITYGRGDFLIRNLIGADPDNGAIAVGDLVEVGQTAQFQVRDAASADEDLHELMRGRTADAALLFTCNGRGSRLFGVPDHDADVVAGALGHRAVAGMSCAGELGPVGGRNFLHGFTASVVLLSGRPDGTTGSRSRSRDADR
jgi:small ligand-binding sensory domain FIST